MDVEQWGLKNLGLHVVLFQEQVHRWDANIGGVMFYYLNDKCDSQALSSISRVF